MKVVLIFLIAQQIVHTGLEKRKVKDKQLLHVSQPIDTALFYKARKKIKRGPEIHINLTKKRFNLLEEAQYFVPDQEDDVFV